MLRAGIAIPDSSQPPSTVPLVDGKRRQLLRTRAQWSRAVMMMGVQIWEDHLTSVGLVATRLQKPGGKFRIVAMPVKTTISEVLQYCVSLWQHVSMVVLPNGAVAAPDMLLDQILSPHRILHLLITTCSTGECPTLDENLQIQDFRMVEVYLDFVISRSGDPIHFEPQGVVLPAFTTIAHVLHAYTPTWLQLEDPVAVIRNRVPMVDKCLGDLLHMCGEDRILHLVVEPGLMMITPCHWRRLVDVCLEFGDARIWVTMPSSMTFAGVLKNYTPRDLQDAVNTEIVVAGRVVGSPCFCLGDFMNHSSDHNEILHLTIRESTW